MMATASKPRRILAWSAVALGLVSAIALAIALGMFLRAPLERELLELPAAERRSLYERTRETLRSTCTQARGPKVTEYCRQQAKFIKRFPECDPECRALAAQFTPLPSR